MQEIDLRIYIKVIIKNWKWLIGFGILTAILAIVFVSLKPPKYTATAAVVIQDAKYRVAFTSEIQDNKLNIPYKAVFELAKSDEILRQVFETSGLEATNSITLREFKSYTNAKTGNDPSWINLSITMADPEETARYANLWAQILVDEVNRLYYSADTSQLAVLQAQVTKAELIKANTEKALTDFQTENQKDIFQTRLNTDLERLAQLSSSRDNLKSTLDKISVFRSTLVNLSDDDVYPEGQFTVFVLQFEALGLANNDAIMSAPLFLVSTPLDTTDSTVQQQKAQLEIIKQSVTRRMTLIEEHETMLETEIFDLQKKLTESEIEESYLTNEYNQAVAMYSGLSKKYAEIELISSLGDNLASIVDEANEPKVPDGVNNLLIVFAATLVSLVVGILVIVFIAWWRVFYLGQNPSEAPGF